MNRNGNARASEDVAAQILETFYSEDLTPGKWLGTEAEMAERFSVSRRDFLKSAGVGSLAASVAGVAEADDSVPFSIPSNRK